MSLNPQELSQLIDDHWGPLTAWVGTRVDAEDIVQQTFIALAGLTKAPENPRAWLYRVAKNNAVNAAKSKKRRRRRQQNAAKNEHCASQANTTLEASELRSLLARLTEDQQEIVVAKIWGQLTFEEIAAHLGISKATAWRIYKSAIESLRSFYNVTCEVNP